MSLYNQAMLSILVVEDEETLHETIALYLRAEDCVVFTGGGGELGLSSAREVEPDLVGLEVIFARTRDKRTEGFITGRSG